MREPQKTNSIPQIAATEMPIVAAISRDLSEATGQLIASLRNQLSGLSRSSR
jgi:hypothetical protein